MGKKVTLPSGNEIEITEAPFADAKALYQALLEEGKSLEVHYNTELDVNFLKDVFCVGFSSKKIESAIWECMKRVLYKGEKITKDTFEPVAAREDYIPICFEVTKENIAPFTKTLMQQYSLALAGLKKALA